MVSLNWPWSSNNDDTDEPTYAGKPVSELKNLKKPYMITVSGGTVVTFDEPRVAWKIGSCGEFDFTAIQLVIPERAKVVYPRAVGLESGYKLRTNMAYVADIYEVNGLGSVVESDLETSGRYYNAGEDSDFQYVKGEVAVPDDFDDSTRTTCTNGIHVYPSKDRAVTEVLN
jgi:hypothetical protein